ncbi:hypothetical protein LTS18_004874 [Coniosporium uncinatum]|uniref:Uncharacterized protein n=1 Tax=Coniosporium uncinatum TaxID=93489 RepID=A0ACC3DCH7_9PEZI|nr:hypothetical protein LTS18_004874 [Coniosporium uncinatum]
MDSDRTVSAAGADSRVVLRAKNSDAPPIRPKATPPPPSAPSPAVRSSSSSSMGSALASPPPPNEAMVSASPSASPSPSVKKPLPGAHIHCLVVEDNLVNQRVLVKGLRNVGCSVQVANHGQEALDIITVTGADSRGLSKDEERRAVVLMDWEMPAMDGLTCVRRVREWEGESGRRRQQRSRQGLGKGKGDVQEGDEAGAGAGDERKRSRLPVIGVTANARPQQIAEAMEAGMDDVVCKPFRVPELLGRIETLLKRIEDEGEAERDRGKREMVAG